MHAVSFFVNSRAWSEQLTNAFSKSREDDKAMFAHFSGWYSFCRWHRTIGTTPIIATGIASESWTPERLLAESVKAMAA